MASRLSILGLRSRRSQTVHKRPKLGYDSVESLHSHLPVIQIKQHMKKFGAIQRDNLDQMYTPNEQDQLQFRRDKWKQLKQRYSPRKIRQQPFEHQLDQIVLDCWKYGQNFGRKTIWKKYRQNFDDLTFDTLKVIRRKK